MPISGLILTLTHRSEEAERLLRDLANDARYALGPRSGQRQPITLTTRDSPEDKDCWHWLQSHRGVAFIDVACVFFEDEQAGEDGHATAPPTHPGTTDAGIDESGPFTIRSQPW